MKKLNYNKLSNTEKLCVRYMAVLLPKPEPIYNLMSFFQLGEGFTEEFLDSYMMMNRPTRNWFLKTYFFIKSARRIYREVLAYEKLSWRHEFEETLYQLKEKSWLIETDHAYMLTPEARKIGLEKLNTDKYNVLIMMEFFIKVFTSQSREEAATKVIFLPYGSCLIQYLSHTHPLRAKLAYLMASVYASIGDLNNAINYQSIDIKITEELYKTPHQDLAISYRAMAVYCFYYADYGSAKYFISKSVENYNALDFSQENEGYQSSLSWQKDIQEAYETDDEDYDEEF